MQKITPAGVDPSRRSPHGERGLKSGAAAALENQIASLPTRGAWIEISLGAYLIILPEVAPHTGSVD